MGEQWTSWRALALALALVGASAAAGCSGDDSSSTDPTDASATDPAGTSDPSAGTGTSPGTSPGTNPGTGTTASSDPSVGSSDATGDPSGDPTSASEPTSGDPSTSGDPTSGTDTGPDPMDGPPAGNPDGDCAVPPEAALEDVSDPDTVIGDGTPASCTSAAVVSAVAGGGVITFDCGPDPITITLDQTAKIFNDTGPKIVLDGGGKVTLSGGGQRRILYQNTCDQNQVWTTPMCQNQDHPQLTVQNLTFVDGDATGEEFEGGGAIFVRGGRFKIINSRFFNNACDDVGPDVGGAAVRTLSQYEGLPVYVVGSTFGGAPGYGNICSNGGGLSSIGVSYTVINSLFTHNEAIGNGANPAQMGTPGGGSGGAIYNDGNTYTLRLCGTRISDNIANEGGGAIFYVSNDLSGSLVIEDSVLCQNPSLGFETQGYPGIFVLANGDPQVSNSTIADDCG